MFYRCMQMWIINSWLSKPTAVWGAGGKEGDMLLRQSCVHETDQKRTVWGDERRRRLEVINWQYFIIDLNLHRLPYKVTQAVSSFEYLTSRAEIIHFLDLGLNASSIRFFKIYNNTYKSWFQSFSSYLLVIKPKLHQLYNITTYENNFNRNVISLNTNYYGKGWFTILSAFTECTVHSFQVGVHVKDITMPIMNKNQLWTHTPTHTIFFKWNLAEMLMHKLKYL
jgi:hypothetical protein